MIKIIVLIGLAAAVFVDSFFIGLFFRFAPKFEGFRRDERIILESKRATGFTLKDILLPFKKSVYKKYYRGLMTEVILTDQRILFKPQLLTCALSVDYNHIDRITEEEYLFNKYICVHYHQKGEEKKFYFHPNIEYKKWLKEITLLMKTKMKANTN